MRYTEEQKKEAIRLANEIGVKEASEQLSISYQSLYAWRKRDADDNVPGEPASSAKKARRNPAKGKNPPKASASKGVRYSEQQKSDALKLASEIGTNKASKQLSIACSTLLAWQKQRSDATIPGHLTPFADEEISNHEYSDQPLEFQVQMLRQEIAELKQQLVRQSSAIQALTKIEE